MSEKENKENQVKETAGTKKEEKVIKEVKKETIKEPEAVEVKKDIKTDNVILTSWRIRPVVSI